MPDADAGLPSVERLASLIRGDLQSDDVALWEVVWMLNTLAPASALDERIRLARRAVASLQGHNELWRGEWPAGPIAPLTEDEKLTLAHDDSPWHDPERADLLVWIRERGSTPSTPAK